MLPVNVTFILLRSLAVSAFTGALNICDCAGDGNRMTLGVRYISVPVSSSDSHCLTTIY